MSEQTKRAWWEEYEKVADELDSLGEPLSRRAADDIRTLVDGLKQHEREKAHLVASLTARQAELVDLLSQARVGLGDYGNPADEVLLGQIDVALGEKR